MKNLISTGKTTYVILIFIALAMTSIPSQAMQPSANEEKGDVGKWIPGNEKIPSVAPEVDAFLQSLQGQLRLLTCKYDKAELTELNTFMDNSLAVGDNVWQHAIEVAPVKDDNTAMDLNITFSLEKGREQSAGVAVAFDFYNWCSDNYVMLPASVYNGNRLKIVDRGYNAGLDRKYLYREGIPLMSVPLPHLSPYPGTVSRLEVSAQNLATPAICFFDRQLKKGFILLTEQKTQFIDNGFIVEESANRKKASFVVNAPGVREKKPLFVGFAESPDRGAELKAGDRIELKMRVYVFDAENIPVLLDKFMAVRKEVTGPNHPRDLIPFSQVADWMKNRINSRWYEGDEFQFYRPENADWISFGWIGGLMNTFPMLALNDSLHRERVRKTFDFAIPRGQGESGYFYGALNFDGKPFGRESYDDFPEIVLARKNSDVLFWMIKQFWLLKAQGNGEFIDPAWENNIQRVADAFVSTWNKYGQWGRMLNVQTGEVAEYNTSGSVMTIGALALASQYYQKPEYLEVAKEAADYYYQRHFVTLGMTTGADADILHNSDSESAAGFMTSLMALYEITGNREWLDKSIKLANLFSTWVTSYDYVLPKETELGGLGAKLAGIVWASTQNKHGTPGICTSSGDPLFKIYRATGKQPYADLMNDIIHAHGESIRPGGFTNERLTYCDAESRGERGTHITGWNELNGFLMALEIPGIYLQTDGDLFYVFDQVKAEIMSRNKKGVKLKISNPTKFDAGVTLFAETEAQATQALGYTSFIEWPKVNIKAGETIEVEVSKNGDIKHQ